MGLNVHLTTRADAADAPAKGATPFGREAGAHLKLFAANNDPTMNFTYTTGPTDQSTKIVFIQVVRLSMDGVYVLPSGYQTKFAYKDPDTTARKFVVDADSGEKDPYYNGDDAGHDGGKQGDAHAHLPAAEVALLNGLFPGAGALADAMFGSATMQDTPGYTDSKFPAGKSNAKAEFRTAVFSAAGADAGTYYAYQDWTFEKEKGKASKITLGTTGIDPGADFKEAVDLWCKNQGFKLPKPAPPPPPPKPGSKKYVVVSGDYLSKIALRFYGNGNLWPKIYAANKAVIGPNPNLIFPGQSLVIP